MKLREERVVSVQDVVKCLSEEIKEMSANKEVTKRHRDIAFKIGELIDFKDKLPTNAEIAQALTNAEPTYAGSEDVKNAIQELRKSTFYLYLELPEAVAKNHGKIASMVCVLLEVSLHRIAELEAENKALKEKL